MTNLLLPPKTYVPVDPRLFGNECETVHGTHNRASLQIMLKEDDGDRPNIGLVTPTPDKTAAWAAAVDYPLPDPSWRSHTLQSSTVRCNGS